MKRFRLRLRLRLRWYGLRTNIADARSLDTEAQRPGIGCVYFGTELGTEQQLFGAAKFLMQFGVPPNRTPPTPEEKQDPCGCANKKVEAKKG